MIGNVAKLPFNIKNNARYRRLRLGLQLVDLSFLLNICIGYNNDQHD